MREVPLDSSRRPSATRKPLSNSEIEQHLHRAIAALKSLQNPDGHWCGELEGDSILQSEYLLMKWMLSQESEPLRDGRPPQTLLRLVHTLRTQQRVDGGWGAYRGSPTDLSATVKAYFCLKLFGEAPDAPHMKRARALVRHLGGAERCNSFTKFFLAALGQVSWHAVPAIPPEIMLLPKWCPFHLSKLSAWSRVMVVPLSIVATRRPTRTLTPALGIGELYLDHDARHRLVARDSGSPFWTRFFARLDRGLKWLHDKGGTPWREAALAKAFDWTRERAGAGGVGAIFPPMVYWQVVLHAMGYDRAHPLVERAERALDALFIEEKNPASGNERGLRIQPCFSPVWDTGIALAALTDCGLDAAGDRSVARGTEWLLKKECHARGDWAANIDAPVAPSGWAFEYYNELYPDCDDTAMVALALFRAGGEANRAAAQRGVRWLLAMQNDDGGWAAFDRSEPRPILECVPFADHNAMQDPSCPDITGRVLESLARSGLTRSHPSVERAIAFIRARQESDGCFIGRWGVNYLYGTWQAVVGPMRCGVDRHEAWIQKAGQWIKSVQHADGSFGESAASYDTPASRGKGPSTASQTSWAAMVLLEVFGPDDPALRRAIEWLCQTQLTAPVAADPLHNPDGDPAGSWCELEYTGTGFPRVFYLRYHLYRLYFPTMALGRFVAALGRGEQGKRLIARGEREALFG